MVTLKNLIVIDINSGKNHSGIITQDGEIYTCGASLLGIMDMFLYVFMISGKLGIKKKKQKFGTEDENLHLSEIKTFKKVKIEEKKVKFAFLSKIKKKQAKATQICCGDNHTICLLENGVVFAWGAKSYGVASLFFFWLLTKFSNWEHKLAQIPQ